MRAYPIKTGAIPTECIESPLKTPLKSALMLGAIIGLLTVATVPAYADIYKITRADGSVVYSDRASNDMNSKIDIVNIPAAPTALAQSDNSNSYTTTAPTPATSVNTSNADNSSNGSKDSNSNKDSIGNKDSNGNKASSTHYQLNILSPIKERAYHRPAQNVEVSVSVSPRLTAGDEVSIMIDGAEVATGLSASIPTTQLNAGKHILEVNVLSSSGVSIALETMTFYVIQNSHVLQQKRQLVEQLNAYNQLPWYKKAMVRLGGKQAK